MKNMNIILKALCVIIIVTSNFSFAQPKIPKEYIPLEGKITLNKNISFPTAIQALSEISARIEKKVIVDPTKQTQRINIDIKNLNWREALELITKVNNLTFKEFENYIEITYPEDSQLEEEEAEEIKVDITTREISISALFFDADRQRLHEIGINWSALKIYDNGGTVVEGGLNTVGEKSADDIFSASVSRVKPDYEVSSLLKTLETDNVGEIIANPQITVMDGEMGRVQIGQDFSIKQRDFAGNVTDQFFSSGIILSVTPKIFTEEDIDFILLEVTTERSSATPSAISTVINKTLTETSVLLYDGEEVAVAGLYSTNDQTTRTGIPLLKDIPKWFFGLRYLFGFNRVEKVKRELIILLKAEIIPAIKDRIAARIEGENILAKKREELRKQFESKIKNLKR